MVVVETNTDVAANEWSLDDSVTRLRVWGSDEIYKLPASAASGWVVGASEACQVRIIDRTGKISRQHAELIRDGETWMIRDLNSKNGLLVDGARRSEAQLAPGVELGLGGVTLIAESARFISQRALMSRLLGWSSAKLEVVDLALRALRFAATRRAPLVLCSDGDTAALARSIHRHVLGDERPFIQCDPRRRTIGASVRSATNYSSGLAALAASAGGSLCVAASRLPDDFELVIAALRDPATRVQLIVCDQAPGVGRDLLGTPIVVPSLAERGAELPRIIDEYGQDAVRSLRASSPFRPLDREWIATYSAESLPDIEKGTRRLVALRECGSAAAAALMLGMSHVALNKWIGRRRIPARSDR